MSIKYAKPSKEGMRQKENKMIIEQKSGFIHISEIIADYLETRKYIGFTKSEAKRLFKQEFKAKGERDE